MGYCNNKGELILPAIYQKAMAFRGKIAPVVCDDLYWWFINEKGILLFNTRQYVDQWPPEPSKGLYKIVYQDPDFGQIAEFYNKHGQPVKVKDLAKTKADTLEYTTFSVTEAIKKASELAQLRPVPDSLEGLCFIRSLFKPFGIHIPAFPSELIQKGREVKQSEVKPGDLVFMAPKNQSLNQIEYVGFITSTHQKEFEFFHYHLTVGIEKSSSKVQPYREKVFTFRRLFN